MTASVAPRPDSACLTCPPPSDSRSWRPADQGYRTCSSCLDRIRDTLADINLRYARLNPAPGANADLESRGAPGFGSRPAASPHIITMRDPRSKSCEVAVDGTLYENWRPDPDGWSRPLPKGVHGPVEPPGVYTTSREVWFGADGRGHEEDESPPRSIPGVLASLCTMVAEERDMTPPTGGVPDLVRWLDQQLDWVTRQEMVTDVADDLRGLDTQLKPVTGDKRRRIGLCPNFITEGDDTFECKAPLYAPTDNSHDDTIRCRKCKREWPHSQWIRLMDILEAS